MRLLIDTHILIWWLNEAPMLSEKARDLITNSENTIYVSTVSIWEIAIKKSLGKLKITDRLLEVVAEEGFESLHIRHDHAIAAAHLPLLHRDPFDRMLVVQAQLENLTLVTRDPNLLAYQVTAIKA